MPICLPCETSKRAETLNILLSKHFSKSVVDCIEANYYLLERSPGWFRSAVLASQDVKYMTPDSQLTNTPVRDHFVVIRIEGLHCHRCEQAIKKQVQTCAGVSEVEVDFASGQASILFDPQQISIPQLMEKIKETGYKPTGFTESHEDSVS